MGLARHNAPPFRSIPPDADQFDVILKKLILTRQSLKVFPRQRIPQRGPAIRVPIDRVTSQPRLRVLQPAFRFRIENQIMLATSRSVRPGRLHNHPLCVAPASELPPLAFRLFPIIIFTGIPIKIVI